MVATNMAKIKKMETLSQKILHNLFKKIQHGTIELHDHSGRYSFGGNADNAGCVKININKPQAYKKILLEGSVGAGRSYIDGDWDTDDLQKLIGLFIKNDALLNKIDGPFSRIFSVIRTLSYRFNTNTVRTSKKNILAHYDLGNEFFELILDPTMMYSCAIYDSPDSRLNDAATKKLQAICDKLALKPSDHVLEIGTGWGGFAIYAAQQYGCKITTTTISNKQHAFVKEKIKRLRLEHQIELLDRDYRKLTGQYDKLVSIEMIEAVGHQYFDQFFHKCNQLVKPEGLFFLQAIVINDQAYDAAKNEVDFIKEYIFPGGCLPSVGSISKSIAKQTKMQLKSLDDIGQHYVTTLNDWHKKLDANKEAILAQGFTEDFIRMWAFYFCYCAAGFEHHYISNIHALWRKRA